MAGDDDLLLGLLSPCERSSAIGGGARASADLWQTTVNRGLQLGVSSLLFRRIQATGLEAAVSPGDVRRLRERYVYHFLRNQRLLGDLGRVLAAFGTEHISGIGLKGAALAEVVYRDPGVRPMGDLDVLVRSIEFSRAAATLVRLGFIPEEPAPSGKAVMFSLGETRLELHSSLTEDGSPFTPEMPGVFDRTRPVSLGGSPGWMLSPEDMLLHLCLHAAYHHVGLVLAPGLRALCDIAFLLDRFGVTLAWRAVVERAGHWRVRRATYLMLRATAAVFRADVPAAVLRELEPNELDEPSMEGVIELVLSNHYADFRTGFPYLAELCLQRRIDITRRMRILRHGLFAPSGALAAAYPPQAGAAPRGRSRGLRQRALLEALEACRLQSARARALVRREQLRTGIAAWLIVR